MNDAQKSPIVRRKSTLLYVGKVPVGGDSPITVQSMTNTNPTAVGATVSQINALEKAGADIVRVSVPTMDAAEAFRKIKEQVEVPLIADIHFDYRIALQVAKYGADCLRINPGNIGNEARIRSVVDCARDKNIPIRIGINGGSLEKDIQEKYGEPTPEALLESAMRHVDILDRLNFDMFKISVKASDVLKSLRIRSRGINFIACPTCSRQEFDVIKTVNELEQRLEDITLPMDVSIIGCVVNGPGEALVSTLGVAGGHNKSSFYEGGVRQKERFDNDKIIDQLENKIRARVAMMNEK